MEGLLAHFVVPSYKILLRDVLRDRHLILCCGKNLALADQNLLYHDRGLAILSGGNVGQMCFGSELWRRPVLDVPSKTEVPACCVITDCSQRSLYKRIYICK
jgi:hypothetical protein